MKVEEISEQIINHPNFENLGFVQQERITAPLYLRWIKICMKCMAYNRERTINLVKNVQWLDPAFRPICLDILNGGLSIGKGNQIQLFS